LRLTLPTHKEPKTNSKKAPKRDLSYFLSLIKLIAIKSVQL